MEKTWKLVEAPSVAAPDRFAHPVIARLLAARAIEDLPAFLDPNFERDIHDPWQFRQMRAAVDRVFAALENNQHITVHGDYDADGVTGSAVIMTTLRELRRNDSVIDFYIPHRDKEGYGLNPTSVQTLKERGTNLIITVDCGIANVAEVKLARELGIDVIVVDHHQFGVELPDGLLIHPRLPGETYPFPHLAAVGVSWKFACALVAEARVRGLPIAEGFEKWLLDFVSIATVTDMVPLVGENRVLETYGLKVLNKTRRPGFRALFRSAGLETGSLSSQSVGFSIGPRLNAAGRMDHASLALKLMLAERDDEAEMLAAELERCNRERQKTTKEMMKEAEEMLVESGKLKVESGTGHRLLALGFYSASWSPSLVGLVAGKFLDRTGKPTIAIGKHGETWIGSGRSVSAYDITAAMKRVGDGILTRCGGHVQACGFALTDDALVPELIRRLQADAAENVSAEACVPVLLLDAELSLADVDWPLIEALAQLEPYGEGNRRPLFMSRNLEVISLDRMGQTQAHVRFNARDAMGRVQKFVGFNLAERFAGIPLGAHLDIAYDVDVNEWNGRRELQCKVVDVHEAQVL